MNRILKCINVLLLSAGTGFASYGKAVDENTAKTIGCNHLMSFNVPGVSSPADLTVAYVATAQANFGIVVDYYVFNVKDGVGFVMVSGDDNVIPILAYSSESSFDINKISPAAKDWVEGYQNQITAVIANNIPAQEGTAEKWKSLMEPKQHAAAKTTTVSPLVTTKWDQDGYYNKSCPIITTGQTYTGCVATAAAQVMNFWKWPTVGSGYHTYTHATIGPLSADFGKTAYDWTNMPVPSATGSSTAAAKMAIKTLMLHVGIAVDMNYGTTSSGAYTLINESPKINCSEYALKTYFHYKRTIHGVQRYTPGGGGASVTSSSAWGTILKTDLDAGRPILYSGQGTSGGHAWVCDGWNSTGFHFNWGWGGGGPDGYYSVDNLAPPTLGIGGGGGNFNAYQAVIVGIEPDTFASSSASVALDTFLDIPAPATSPSAYPVPAFSVVTQIKNTGSASFSGDFCAQVFDSAYKYVMTLQTLTGKTLAAGESQKMTFASATSMFAMIPGYYRIRVMHHATGSTTWTPVGDKGVFINENDIDVANEQPLRLHKKITLSTGTGAVKIGQPLTVSSNIENRTAGNWSGGKVQAVLVNVATGTSTTIQSFSSELINYNSNKDYSFYIAAIPSASVTPGTYIVGIQHANSTSLSSMIYTGSDEFMNPVIVTVGNAAGVTTPTLDPERISVYPNPSNDVINIKMDGVQVSAMTITDVYGRKIQDITPDAIQSVITVPVSNYPAGIYFVNLFSGSEVVSKKIVVAK